MEVKRVFSRDSYRVFIESIVDFSSSSWGFLDKSASAFSITPSTTRLKSTKNLVNFVPNNQ